jgi:hypothetical protein
MGRSALEGVAYAADTDKIRDVNFTASARAR